MCNHAVRAKFLITIAAAILLAVIQPTRAAEPAPDELLRADLPYQAHRSDPIVHEVDFAVIVTPPDHSKLLKVWLPLPQSDEVQEISDRQITTFPDELEPRIASEPVYGNSFAYFEFREPKGAQIIRHRFTARLWDLHWNVDPQSVADVDKWPDSFKPFFDAQPIASAGEFQRVLANLVPEKRGPARDLYAVMDWVDESLKYDHAAASLKADASQAFETRRGHCSDYHGLCATMGRSLGYPARVTYGLSLFPKSSPSHCKLEAFLPPYGWVSFDVSETQKLVESIRKNESLPADEREQLIRAARERLHRGFRENSWLLVTRGTDYELAPRASAPVRVVRTIYAEADGEPLPDPDPANSQKREFAWMTAHRYKADKPFLLPFRDIETLKSVDP